MTPTRVQIAQAVIDMIAKNGVHSAMRSLAAYAHENDIDVELLMKDIARIAEEDFAQLNIEISSVRPLNKTTQEHIAQKLKQLTNAKDVYTHERIDESLIGGAMAKTHEYTLDLSVRGRLNKLLRYRKAA